MEREIKDMNDRQLAQAIDEEVKRWELEQMLPFGVPKHPSFPIPGIPVSLFSLQIKIEAIFQLLIELDLSTSEKIERRISEIMLEKMTDMREEALKEKREAQEGNIADISVARSKLLGPDGRELRKQ